MPPPAAKKHDAKPTPPDMKQPPPRRSAAAAAPRTLRRLGTAVASAAAAVAKAAPVPEYLIKQFKPRSRSSSAAGGLRGGGQKPPAQQGLAAQFAGVSVHDPPSDAPMPEPIDSSDEEGAHAPPPPPPPLASPPLGLPRPSLAQEVAEIAGELPVLPPYAAAAPLGTKTRGEGSEVQPRGRIRSNLAPDEREELRMVRQSLVRQHERAKKLMAAHVGRGRGQRRGKGAGTYTEKRCVGGGGGRECNLHGATRARWAGVVVHGGDGRGVADAVGTLRRGDAMDTVTVKTVRKRQLKFTTALAPIFPWRT